MSIYIRELARELTLHGAEVDIFSRTHGPRDSRIVTIAPHARLIHLDAGPPETPKDQLRNYIPEFIHNLQEFVYQENSQYDVIHSHYWLSALAGLPLARNWDIPHISTFHTLQMIKLMALPEERPDNTRAPSEEKIAKSTDAIIVSDSHEKEFLMHFYGVLPSRIHIVPCGVDTALFHPMDRSQSKQAIGTDGKPLVLFVGRLDPLKGTDLLLYAISMLNETSDSELLIVGGESQEEPEMERLKGLTKQLGLTDLVRFEGSIPHNKLPLYYNAAEVLVMPSYAESFGLTALEAMACGTPVIAARVGGLASLINDGSTGYLVPWHRPDAFAQRLEVLLTNPHLRDAMGKAALKRAEQLGWDKLAKRVLVIYKKLMEQFPESAIVTKQCVNYR